MQYYRRKPLDILPVDVLAAEAERLANRGEDAVPGRMGPSFVQPSAIDDIASVLPLHKRPESGVPPVDPGVLPHKMSALSPDQSGADLVARAVEILHQDLASGALAAGAAPPFQSVFPALNNGSLPMTNGLPMANGLPDNLGETLNSLLQSAAQMQSPAGKGVSPAIPPIRAPWGGTVIPAAEETVPLRPARTVRAGEQATIPFKLHNDSFRPVQISLQKADLTSPTGQRIPQSEITITPQEISLAPDGTAEIVITIRIPTGTPPGVYSGPLTAQALPYLHGILTVTVD